MLNSVSVSLQRQAMVKSKDTRKGKGGKGGRAQESEASMVTRSAGKSAATGDSEGSSLQGGDTVTPPVLTIAPRPDDTTPPEGEELDLDIPIDFLHRLSLFVLETMFITSRPEMAKLTGPTGKTGEKKSDDVR